MIFPLERRQLIRGCKEHIEAGLGCAADYVANHDYLYAPCDGKIEKYYGEQGGNWLRVIRDNGDKIEFAHLYMYLKTGDCNEGEQIAVTGNTGKVTTGPHLHIQIFDNKNQRIDPEKYFAMETVKFQITCVNPPAWVEDFKNRVKTLTKGGLELISNDYSKAIPVPAGMLTGDQAKEIIDELNIQAQAVFVFYPTNSTSTYAAASYYPEKNLSFVTIPNSTNLDIVTHEFLHLIRKYINFNKIGFIEDVEYYAPNWRFEEQYAALIPLLGKLKMMINEEQLNKLYLGFFKRPVDDSGRTYYGGKTLDEVLDSLLASKEHQQYTPVFQAVKQVENAVRAGQF